MSDGSTTEFLANIVAENLFPQCKDSEGNQHLAFREIIGHRKNDTALVKEDAYTYHNDDGIKIPIRTTKGWDICIEWRDGSNSRLPLRYLKDSTRSN